MRRKREKIKRAFVVTLFQVGNVRSSFVSPLSETETFMDRPQTMFGSCFHQHCLVSQVLLDVHRRKFPRNSRYLNLLARCGQIEGRILISVKDDTALLTDEDSFSKW